jgi:tetratricopeptide (TPR) repeat protein
MLIKSDSSNSDVLYTLRISSETEEMKEVPLEMNEIILGGGSDVDISLSKVPEKLLQFTRTSQGYSVKSFSPTVLLNEKKLERSMSFTSEDILSIHGFSMELVQTTKEEVEEEKRKREAEFNPKDVAKTQFMQVVTVKELETKGRFVGVSGSVKGRVFEFMKDKLSVGRDPSNDICVELDGLSRGHAVIEVNDQCLTVMDFNSTNGTFVNGRKVVSETVKPGAIIQFANAGFRYEGLKGAGAVKPMGDAKNLLRLVIFTTVIGVLLGGGFLAGYSILTQKQKKVTQEIAVKKKELETLVFTPTPTQKDLSVAEQALTVGQYEEALSIVESILQKSPGEASAVLLKGKIEKQQKLSSLKSLFEKGARYFEDNDFERAQQMLSSIESDFSEYDAVKTMLQQMEQLSLVEPAYNQAWKDFNEGKLDAVRSSLEFILKKLPGYKKAKDMQAQVDILDACFTSINKDNENLEESTRSFELMLRTIPQEDNFFHRLAKQKLKELKTGKHLKVETLYASAIAMLGEHKYDSAYGLLKKALNFDPHQIKVKITFSEVKKRREKILEQWNQIAIALSTENPSKAKIFWKKIIDSGPEDNAYYQDAADSLQK